MTRGLKRVTGGGATCRHLHGAAAAPSHLSFPEGVQAHIFAFWNDAYMEHRMIVVGADGMVPVDDVLAMLDTPRRAIAPVTGAISRRVTGGSARNG